MSRVLNNTVNFIQKLTRNKNFMTLHNNYATTVKTSRNIKDITDIQKSVFISQSNDIFTNLALEDWIYKNYDFTNHHVMLLWTNKPCVVIGRHQNPWKEADVSAAEKKEIKIARRNSGGGTVYHDEGNLNMTFFTPRERYDRKRNLDLVTRALFREWGIKAEVSPREDIVLEGNFKISGTAAKLGQPNAYHHCTLLVNVDKNNITQVLHSHESGIKSNATPSVRSKVVNLFETDERVNVARLMKVLGYEYMREKDLTLRESLQTQRGFQYVNPTEEWFPGLNKIRDEYASWEWRFGKTPKFSVSKTFNIPETLLETDLKDDSKMLTISVNVEKGLINDICLSVPKGLSKRFNDLHAEIVLNLQGQKFSEDSIKVVEMKLQEKDKFVADCFRQIVNHA